MKKFFSILALVAALGLVSACAQQAKSSGDGNAVAPAPQAAPSAAPASCGGGGKG
jgi:hypothetical protein